MHWIAHFIIQSKDDYNLNWYLDIAGCNAQVHSSIFPEFTHLSLLSLSLSITTFSYFVLFMLSLLLYIYFLDSYSILLASSGYHRSLCNSGEDYLSTGYLGLGHYRFLVLLMKESALQFWKYFLSQLSWYNKQLT